MPHDHGPVLQFEVDTEIDLTTLGAAAAIFDTTKIDGSRAQGFYLIWVKIAGFFSGKTATEGPIIYGIACNLDATKLKAILEDDLQNRQDPTSTGPGSWYLPICEIGVDAVEGNINGDVSSTNVQATSEYKKYAVKWTIPEGDNFSQWAFNKGSGALTTGMKINASMQFFGSWLRD